MSEARTLGFAPPEPARRGRKLRWPWNAAVTVVALNLALVVAIFLVFALLCVQGYQTTLDQARSRAQSAANIVQEETEWMFGAARTVLQQIAATVPDPQSVHTGQLDHALDSLPTGVDLGVYDASGDPSMNRGSTSLPGNISGEDFFKSLAGGEDWVVSRQLADASSKEPIFVVAQRLGGPHFTGVALLSIGGDVLKEFWAPQQLGAGSTVGILREDGWLVARYPAAPEAVSSATQPPFTTQKGQNSGTYDSPHSPVDGIARIVAFDRLPQFNLVAVASVSQDAAVAQLWTAIITVLWLMVPIAAALLVASLITAGLLRRSARTQASLTAALSNNDVLFREIHHRVKNNLQSVASLLQMQPIPREVKVDMSQRIAAMSAVHEHIYRSNNFASVEVKDYLQVLIQNIRAGSPEVTVVENIEDVSVDKDAATPLGLILNEVVSNAFKHAFKDGRKGVVTVSLTRRGDNELCLTVDDNGVGFDPDVPAKGIGRRLIAALTQQLGGQSGFSASSSGGSRFTLTFPPGLHG